MPTLNPHTATVSRKNPRSEYLIEYYAPVGGGVVSLYVADELALAYAEELVRACPGVAKYYISANGEMVDDIVAWYRHGDEWNHDVPDGWYA